MTQNRSRQAEKQCGYLRVVSVCFTWVFTCCFRLFYVGIYVLFPFVLCGYLRVVPFGLCGYSRVVPVCFMWVFTCCFRLCGYLRVVSVCFMWVFTCRSVRFIRLSLCMFKVPSQLIENWSTVWFISVKFSMLSMRPYAFHPVSQRFPQRFL